MKELLEGILKYTREKNLAQVIEIQKQIMKSLPKDRIWTDEHRKYDNIAQNCIEALKDETNYEKRLTRAEAIFKEIYEAKE